MIITRIPVKTQNLTIILKALFNGQHIVDNAGREYAYFRKGDEFEINDFSNCFDATGIFQKVERINFKTKEREATWIFVASSFNEFEQFANNFADEEIALIAANATLGKSHVRY